MTLDQAGLDQQLEVAGNTRLRLPEDGDEFADGQLRVVEEGQQAQPGRFAGGGQGEQDVVEAGGIAGQHLGLEHAQRYKDIFMSVKGILPLEGALFARWHTAGCVRPERACGSMASWNVFRRRRSLRLC